MLLPREWTIGCTLIVLSALRPAHGNEVYEVNFAATWSGASHPSAYPANAHFSPLIGGVHSDQVSFWAPGGLATPGIEQMAEVGGVVALRGEVQAAINAQSAFAVIQGSNVPSPGSATLSIEVSASFPLVTLVTMVAPTPDWFVGVHGLDLRDGASWKDEVTVDLFGYDAGTEDGTGFSLANSATVPPQPIELLESPFGVDDPPLARLIFTRMPEPKPSWDADFDGDLDVDHADLANWRGGFGLAASAAKTQGDADGDLDVDGADFLIWQRQVGNAANPAVAAVPEPTLLGWLTGAVISWSVIWRRVQAVSRIS
jgi:hypothetical protein